MARLHPLRAVRFDLEHVKLAGVLAPPYDVIDPELQETLYGRDLRNIVRIDYGKELPGDVPGREDRYTRAAAHLESWLRLGILERDPRPAVYVYEHEFPTDDGRRLQRRGIFARVAARPWERSEVLPHERTLRGPKEDRLALMRATRMQTSAVFALWDGAVGIDAALEAATAVEPHMTGHHRGEVGREEHRLWVVDNPRSTAAILESLSPARLYVADGHHRFETAAAYAAERRAEEPGAPDDAGFAFALVHICDARDPAIEVLPTHRLLRAAAGLPSTLAELRARLDARFAVEPRADLATAFAEAGAVRAERHAFAVAARDGVALVHAPRVEDPSPRARLDATVLEDGILAALGVGPERIAGGALAYTRRVEEADTSVRAGDALFAFCLSGCTPAEIIAVSDAGETMPQKSTYFYPKVPTGLILSPL